MGSMRRNMPSRQQINVPNKKYEHKSTPMVENKKNDYLQQFIGGKGGHKRRKKK